MQNLNKKAAPMKNRFMSYLVSDGMPKGDRQRFKQLCLHTNVDRMFALSIYVIVLQIALNIINIVNPSNAEHSVAAGSVAIPIGYYIVLSLGALVLGIVFLVLFSLIRKHKIENQLTQQLTVYVFLYTYLAIQLVFCTFNILNGSGINSFIIAIIIVCVIPVMHPVVSLPTIFCLAFYTVAAMYFTRDVATAWNSIMAASTWANLIIIIGLLAVGSVLIYRMYADNFSQSIQLEEFNEELRIMADTDHMTGIPNRRSLSRSFQEVWQTSRAGSFHLAVAIADIDFFKHYNDNFGHLEGDECLKKVAGSLQACFRRGPDIVSRYGGEEFLMVFTAEREHVFDLAERARQSIEEMCIPHAVTTVSPYVTVSIGVCLVAPTEDVTMDAVLKAADDALYEAKHLGRNRTVLRSFSDVHRAGPTAEETA